MTQAAEWTVTVVCGASGVGKSSVARPLAARFGVPLIEADDIVTALTALTTPATSGSGPGSVRSTAPD